MIRVRVALFRPPACELGLCEGGAPLLAAFLPALRAARREVRIEPAVLVPGLVPLWQILRPDAHRCIRKLELARRLACVALCRDGLHLHRLGRRRALRRAAPPKQGRPPAFLPCPWALGSRRPGAFRRKRCRRRAPLRHGIGTLLCCAALSLCARGLGRNALRNTRATDTPNHDAEQHGLRGGECRPVRILQRLLGAWYDLCRVTTMPVTM